MIWRTEPLVLTLNEDFVKLSAHRPVAIAQLRITKPVPLHGHRFHELSVIASGRATHVAGGLEFPLGPGSVVLAEAGATHAYADVYELAKRNLYFSSDWLAAEFWPEPLTTESGGDGVVDLMELEAIVLEPSGSAIAMIENELNDIECELARSQPSQTMLRACVLKILVHVARALPDGVEATVIRARPELWSTLRMVDALAAAGAPLDRRELGRRIGLTADTLNRLVRSETGCSLTDLYQRARIRRACRMLRGSGTISITEVAHRLGFSDGAHFHRHFLKQMGLPPSEWRKRVD